ncbi:hypothetical protein B0T25DRAFT_580816 [Lasiosphaeria hispida]|uniref:Uncharacterized protein n=1 Tax=Lasiosphaeria hispida TaxID=260671 RepID=A0AAJ0HHV4_9PEZI|nr:hypothetical protein B0T25DRAFT_580816 [Lasiosphaeria hispida]
MRKMKEEEEQDDEDQEEEEQEDLTDSDDEDEDAIPNPPDGELQAGINRWARSHGFGVNRFNGRSKKEDLYTRYELLCDRFGRQSPIDQPAFATCPPASVAASGRHMQSGLLKAGSSTTTPNKNDEPTTMVHLLTLLLMHNTAR